MSIFHRFRRQPEEDLNAQQSTGIACLSQMACLRQQLDGTL